MFCSKGLAVMAYSVGLAVMAYSVGTTELHSGTNALFLQLTRATRLEGPSALARRVGEDDLAS